MVENHKSNEPAMEQEGELMEEEDKSVSSEDSEASDYRAKLRSLFVS
jgi:hypothetical protein